MLTVVYYTDISFMGFSHNLVLYLDYFLKQQTVDKDHEANDLK
jgi:hypothetical protein